MMTDSLVDRLLAKRQVRPAMGGGTISSDGTATSYITDDGKRLVNPDGPEAANVITALEGALNYVADNTYCGADAEWHFKPDYDPQAVLDALSLLRGDK